MRLFCVGRYQSSLGKFRVGEEIVVDDEAGELLLRDSPGSFSFDEPKAEARPRGRSEKAKGDGVIAFDVESSPIADVKAYAATRGIELEDNASDEDIRAAVALAIEAMEKVESEPAAGTSTNVRPQRRSRAR